MRIDKPKSINLTLETWKKLSKIKLDKNFKTFEDLIKYFLKNGK